MRIQVLHIFLPSFFALNGKALASILECEPVTQTVKRMGLVLLWDPQSLTLKGLIDLRNMPEKIACCLNFFEMPLPEW